MPPSRGGAAGQMGPKAAHRPVVKAESAEGPRSGVHENLGRLRVPRRRFGWTAAKTRVSWRVMKRLGSVLLRLLTVWLVATLATASVGPGAPGAAPAGDPPHVTMHAEMPTGAACPTDREAARHGHEGHAICAMTVCCFSDGPVAAAVAPGTEIRPAGHQAFVEGGLPQSEPERAKKPPRHT